MNWGYCELCKAWAVMFWTGEIHVCRQCYRGLRR